MSTDTKSLIPPTDLPALDDLVPYSARMAMRRCFQQGGAQEHNAYVLQLNAVRLADTAVAEYKLARETIRMFHAERKGIGGSTPLTRTLPRRLKMGQKECHVQAKKVQRR